MTDQSPEPRDPWAPPERPAVDLGKQQGVPGVHDQQTVAGMPGAGMPPGAPPAGQAPVPASQPGPTPAYGYPAQPDPAGYGYPAPPAAPQTPYGYPGQPAAPQAPYGGYQGYPGYPGQGGFPAYPQRSNGFGVTALVLGIIAVVTCYLGLLFGVPAVIFGVLGRGKAKRGEADNGGMALAGIITGAVGIAISCLMIVLIVVGVIFGDPDSDSEGGYSGPRNTQVLYQD
ncbi:MULTISPECIES: DUF4190 domain-containing protein [unclassified Streptomyces]|uniref:DUF4190 domain-containing protein n=1 Tax=unclassified Streptomyces TaxID=2593676 RepID=UPI000DC78342|nr:MULTISPECIES: DUF4190 domain-containing protein [unclassified Streptomyces]AWZ04371.1 hypothetical protein DRB89_06705 [Streptomyces sp. ICC4]AWZ14268.1 hypothetical protein DRB96_20610 [Streptomyces sp. ICC1]